MRIGVGEKGRRGGGHSQVYSGLTGTVLMHAAPYMMDT